MKAIPFRKRPIRFWKMSGAGNDFIVLNPREAEPPQALDEFVRLVCARRVSVGADGVVLVSPSANPQAHVRVRFFNPDGGEFDTCGNGARCAARFAFEAGLAPADMTMETGDGLLPATVRGERVRIAFADPRRIDLHMPVTVDGRRHVGHRVEFGVPHFVIPVERLPEGSIEAAARKIRYASELSPAGANVNYVELGSPNTVAIRTYERGVEGETLACGSGCVSAAVALAAEGRVTSPVRALTKSGSVLEVSFQREGDRFFAIRLEGEARIVYRAELGPDATTWLEGPPSA